MTGWIDMNEIESQERELIRRAIQNVQLKPDEHTQPRWVLVKRLFACGSTTALFACNKYGFDPDYAVEKQPAAPDPFGQFDFQTVLDRLAGVDSADNGLCTELKICSDGSWSIERESDGKDIAAGDDIESLARWALTQ